MKKGKLMLSFSREKNTTTCVEGHLLHDCQVLALYETDP